MAVWRGVGKDFSLAEVTAMFRRALELGINFIDTAECYGDHLSEQFIGTALKEIGGDARSRFILATKCGHHFVKPFGLRPHRQNGIRGRELDCQAGGALVWKSEDLVARRAFAGRISGGAEIIVQGCNRHENKGIQIFLFILPPLGEMKITTKMKIKSRILAISRKNQLHFRAISCLSWQFIRPDAEQGVGICAHKYVAPRLK